MHFKKIIPMVIALLAMPFFMMAQVTTSSISGVVKDKSGNPLVGSTITATHTPTGTVYTSVARTGGRFDINNMNPGGPYVITSTFVGFETTKKEDIYLTLGEISRVDFELSDKSTELTTVVVSGTRTAAKGANETQIGRDKLAVLPTIGRNLNDYVRFTPQTKITSTGGISIAGQNNRYNGFLIDGAVNNDVFGLSDQGTNGGRAGTPPISIDAVDQIVVQLSPYDAALGNFTGGAINAITKSGTNSIHGSAYYIFRNQDMAGKTPGRNIPDSARLKLSNFKNQTYGFTIGGPIVKNKAFFFVNAEIQKDSRPQPYTPQNVLNPDGSIRYNIVDSVTKLQNFLRTKYGYETGDYLNNPDDIDRVNINSRFDFNLNAKNKLTLSYRYTKAERTNPGRSTNNTINFANSAEFFPSTTHSGNGELNTKFSNKMNNKFRVSFTNVVDDRGPTGSPFPAVGLQSFNGGPTINFGTEAASSANLLKQTIINFYDAFKYYAGNHALTVGADIDFNKSYNLFMNRAFGLYGYNNLGAAGPSQIGSLQAFMEDRGAQRIRRGYSLVDDNSKGGDLATGAAANFKSVRLGFFVNDDIKISNNFTLTVGLRADKTNFTTNAPEDVFFNDTARSVIAGVYDIEGAVSGGQFKPKWQLSPRIGFKVNLDEEGVVIRGGLGIFGGRTPLVWPGGVYQNNGVTIGALDVSGANGTSPALLGGNPVPFRDDVNNQYTQANFGLAPSLIKPQGDMNIVAKNFHLPAVFRGSVGAEKKLGNGWSVNFDIMYTKNIYEVDWVNVNFAPPALTTTGPDARLVYSTTGQPTKLIYRPTGATAAARNPYANVILIRNTTGKKGFSYNFTTGIEKQTKKGLVFSANYSYGNSQVHNEATSSVNTSNWLNMEAVSSRNYIGLSTSDFDMGHRIFALISKKFTYLAGKMATTVSFAYNGQSGSPYSYTMSGNGFIGDGGTNNDLMYIPLNRAEMDQMSFPTNGALTETIQKDQFEEFIKSDKYLSKNRGKFAERNGARSPFTNILDANVQQDFSVKTGNGVRHTLSVRFDIFNLTNLIDKNAGRQYFFNFDQAQVLQVVSFTGTKPNYRFNRPIDNKVGAISDGISAFNSSRWNGQVTIRYSF